MTNFDSEITSMDVGFQERSFTVFFLWMRIYPVDIFMKILSFFLLHLFCSVNSEIDIEGFF